MSRSQQDEDEARGSCANNKTPYLTHCVERNDVEVNKSQQKSTKYNQLETNTCWRIVEEKLPKKKKSSLE